MSSLGRVWDVELLKTVVSSILILPDNGQVGFFDRLSGILLVFYQAPLHISQKQEGRESNNV